MYSYFYVISSTLDLRFIHRNTIDFLSKASILGNEIARVFFSLNEWLCQRVKTIGVTRAWAFGGWSEPPKSLVTVAAGSLILMKTRKNSPWTFFLSNKHQQPFFKVIFHPMPNGRFTLLSSLAAWKRNSSFISIIGLWIQWENWNRWATFKRSLCASLENRWMEESSYYWPIMSAWTLMRFVSHATKMLSFVPLFPRAIGLTFLILALSWSLRLSAHRKSV